MLVSFWETPPHLLHPAEDLSLVPVLHVRVADIFMAAAVGHCYPHDGRRARHPEPAVLALLELACFPDVGVGVVNSRSVCIAALGAAAAVS